MPKFMTQNDNRWPGRSSSSVNVRPRAGATPRVENRFAETREPGMTRAPSPFILLNSRTTGSQEASESNVWFRCRQSKKLGYELPIRSAPAGFVALRPAETLMSRSQPVAPNLGTAMDAEDAVDEAEDRRRRANSKSQRSTTVIVNPGPRRNCRTAKIMSCGTDIVIEYYSIGCVARYLYVGGNCLVNVGGNSCARAKYLQPASRVVPGAVRDNKVQPGNPLCGCMEFSASNMDVKCLISRCGNSGRIVRFPISRLRDNVVEPA